ncbi:MAG: tRNA (N6-threonylcarbamoyladenosine(37)-N6)-methyltransferase TrmO [Thermoplasmatota archaeon]
MQDIRKIGVVHNDMHEPTDPFEMRKQESVIEIHEQYADGLYRIEDSDYIQVVFRFHRSEGYKLRTPTYSGDVKGVFASRSPHRPSAIGVTTARLLQRDGTRLRVKGLDAIHGTPVLDIKPYTPTFDEAEQRQVAREHAKASPRFEIMRLVRTGALEELLLRAGQLHGHFCPGLALGVMAAAYVVREMGWAPEGMEHVVAVVETNNCFADGVQYVTGCTFGNNALVFRDLGKTAFTLAGRNGEGVRIAARPRERRQDEFSQLFKTVVRDRGGSKEDEARFKEVSREHSFEILEHDIEELFTVECVAVELPAYAPIHDSVICDICHQPVMATRIVGRGNRQLCLSCAHAPYYELTGAGIARKER